jgi:transposase-like protein
VFVGAFRERPLKGSFPYRRLDALWLNVRQDHWIVSQAHLVAIDGRGTADREIMGFSLGRSEEYASGRISCGD